MLNLFLKNLKTSGKSYSNYKPYLNQQKRKDIKASINDDRRWFPSPKAKPEKVKEINDKKGTEKLHKMNSMNKEYCKKVFEHAKNKDFHSALSAYHKIDFGRVDIRVFTALLSTVLI